MSEPQDTTEKPSGSMVYIRTVEQDRLDKLRARERRTRNDQLAVILDEACKRRGLDPETVEPLKPQTTGVNQP